GPQAPSGIRGQWDLDVVLGNVWMRAGAALDVAPLIEGVLTELRDLKLLGPSGSGPRKRQPRAGRRRKGGEPAKPREGLCLLGLHLTSVPPVVVPRCQADHSSASSRQRPS